jgi:hypothetical protein
MIGTSAGKSAGISPLRAAQPIAVKVNSPRSIKGFILSVSDKESLIFKGCFMELPQVDEFSARLPVSYP